MSPTLLEGAVAILLVVVALWIGRILTPCVIRWLREHFPRRKANGKKKPPSTIDI
ncbi:MAG TPA: hypothetical protein VHY22_05095 [Chthoniobacteraceae bacterium]|nr:hypothetical protein [Chthoniobacteraceae bacterium]